MYNMHSTKNKGAILEVLPTEQADALVIIHLYRKDPDNIRYKVVSYARDDARNSVSVNQIFLSWVALGAWLEQQQTNSDDPFVNINEEELGIIRRVFNAQKDTEEDV